MKKVKTCLVVIGIVFMAYSCAVSCGPGPGQSTASITYPSGYTWRNKAKKSLQSEVQGCISLAWHFNASSKLIVRIVRTKRVITRYFQFSWAAK